VSNQGGGPIDPRMQRPAQSQRRSRRGIPQTLSDMFTGSYAAIRGMGRSRRDGDGGPEQGDPWERSRARWGARPGDGNSEGDGQRGRSAWGDRPDQGTQAAIASAPPTTPRAGRGTPAQSRGVREAWRQLTAWARSGFKRSALPSVNVLVLTCILGVIVLSGAGMSLFALSDYLSISNQAKDGIAQIRQMESDLGIGAHAHTTNTPAAFADLQRAHDDFQAVHDRLASPDFILSTFGHIGFVQQRLQSGAILSQLGVETTQMMEQIFPAIYSMAKIVATSPVSSAGDTASNASLVSTGDLLNIQQGLIQARPLIDQMIATVASTPQDTLIAALSSSQRKEILPFLQFVPQIPNALNIANDFLKIAPVVLGIQDGPVAYVLTTLDNGEIRPAGGFQGQMALFQVAGGHFSHISLQDVYQLEPTDPPYSDFRNSNYGEPAAEQGWWPSSLEWDLRNSGLSPDFPTTAQYLLNELHSQPLCKKPLVTPNPNTTDQIGCPGSQFYNGTFSYDQNAYYPNGNHVPVVNTKSGAVTGYDPAPAQMGGVIAMQPAVIEQMIGLIGSVHVGCPYNVDVTPTNLQTLVHYYQETTKGRAIGKNSCAGGSSDATKRFASIVAKTLLDKLKTINKGDLLGFVGMLLHDLQTRDLQVYFADPNSATYQPFTAGENFLDKYQASDRVYQGAGDSLMVNQANYAGDKMNLYMQMKLVDNVQLTSNGTAIHDLQFDYTYNIPHITVNPADAANGEPAYKIDVYNVIFNAAYDGLYREYRRVYVPPGSALDGGYGLIANPNAPASAVGYVLPYGADAGNRKVFGSYYFYSFNYDQASNSVIWSAPNGIPNPKMQWEVPNAVQNGAYTLMLQRQSGVPTSVDITVSCYGQSGQLLHVARSITQDTPITVPNVRC
jgi:hypothetical protein